MGERAAATRYLDLLSACLTRELFLDQEVRDVDLRPPSHWLQKITRPWLDVISQIALKLQRQEERARPASREGSTLAGRSILA